MARVRRPPREVWKNQLGFILAAVGSAVGLGNIWRFSYMTYENGGGAFLIPYFIALFTVGIPLMILEFSLGHKFSASAPLAFSKLNRRFEWVGWWTVTFVMFGIVLYYSVIISWCLNYLLFSFTLAWGDDPGNYFFKEFLSISEGPGEIGTVQTPIFLGLIVIWFLNWVIVHRGIQGGIELANKIFMPILFFLTSILVFWSITLEGAEIGLKAYLNPDFSVLTKPKVWIDAFTQIFFSLSLGFGIMIAYASYLPERANLSRNAFITALVNCGFSVFSGIAVFSILGYMSVEMQKPINEVVTQSIGLAFVAYPTALSLLPGGAFFGVLFFTSLVVAGLSSSVSIIEAFSSAAVDKFPWDRKRIVTCISVLGLGGSVIFTTNGGLFWLDIVDHFITHFGLITVGILEAVLVSWFFPLESLRHHINTVSDLKIGPWWSLLIRYFVPLILIIITGTNLFNEFQKPYEGYPISSLIFIGINWLVITIIIALFFSRSPWKTLSET
ncbi:MAG: sodium-dependent transporter [Nitrospirae bacterium]|nr:sodium-dependent transporter [Candidatus Manganitrophaceae bacterium]